MIIKKNLIKDILKTYPKSIELLSNFLIEKNIIRLKDNTNWNNLRILYDFFDKQNIIIQLFYNSSDEEWSFYITGYQNLKYISDDDYINECLNQGLYYSTRQRTEYEAFLLSFKILENILNKKINLDENKTFDYTLV